MPFSRTQIRALITYSLQLHSFKVLYVFFVFFRGGGLSAMGLSTIISIHHHGKSSMFPFLSTRLAINYLINKGVQFKKRNNHTRSKYLMIETYLNESWFLHFSILRKANMPTSITYLNQTLIFKWNVVVICGKTRKTRVLKHLLTIRSSMYGLWYFISITIWNYTMLELFTPQITIPYQARLFMFYIGQTTSFTLIGKKIEIYSKHL